jgi:hypothetical protein
MGKKVYGVLWKAFEIESKSYWLLLAPVNLPTIVIENENGNEKLYLNNKFIIEGEKLSVEIIEHEKNNYEVIIKRYTTLSNSKIEETFVLKEKPIKIKEYKYCICGCHLDPFTLNNMDWNPEGCKNCFMNH